VISFSIGMEVDGLKELWIVLQLFQVV